MTSYNSTFKRVEKKYRLSRDERGVVEHAAASRMAPDSFGRTRITSLYLDTPERAMIARSIEKPLYKEKLRLRAYGEVASALLLQVLCNESIVRKVNGIGMSKSAVHVRCEAACAERRVDACSVAIFFELKKKFKGTVYKRRVALSLPAALAFFSGWDYEHACECWPLQSTDAHELRSESHGEGRSETEKPSLANTQNEFSFQNIQIAHELECAMNRWLPLVPSMGIACYREAWAPRADVAQKGFDADLRITFDDRLRYCNCLDDAGWCDLIDPNETIMEIKSAGAYSAWLVGALSKNRIYPTSFTKYGNAYRKEMKCSMQHSLRYSETPSPWLVLSLRQDFSPAV